MLEFSVPTRPELLVRQRWLSDPDVMAYNAGWGGSRPGYDADTGCLAWPESEWDRFAGRLARPADQQGYFYVRDTVTEVLVGDAHYEVGLDGAASIGLMVVPALRGRGLGERVLRELVSRIWRDTSATEIVNEFEDERASAVRLHRRCGFAPDAATRAVWGRPTRTWRLARPQR